MEYEWKTSPGWSYPAPAWLVKRLKERDENLARLNGNDLYKDKKKGK